MGGLQCNEVSKLGFDHFTLVACLRKKKNVEMVKMVDQYSIFT